MHWCVYVKCKSEGIALENNLLSIDGVGCKLPVLLVSSICFCNLFVSLVSLLEDKQWFKFGGVITHIYMSYLCLFKVKLRKFSSNNKMFIFRFYLFAVRSMKEA